MTIDGGMSFDLSALLEGTEWEAYQRWLDAPVAEGNESLCDR